MEENNVVWCLLGSFISWEYWPSILSQRFSKRTWTQLSQSSHNQSSQKLSSNKQPSKKQLNQNQFISQFLEHIGDVFNVEGDENYDYIVIVLLHGYGKNGWPIIRWDLDNELRKIPSLKLFRYLLLEVKQSLIISCLDPSPREKWMALPYMSYVTANQYNFILTYLRHPSLIFFLMTTSHLPVVSIYYTLVCQPKWLDSSSYICMLFNFDIFFYICLIILI